MLYDVAATDIPTFGVLSLALIGVTLLACWIRPTERRGSIRSMACANSEAKTQAGARLLELDELLKAPCGSWMLGCQGTKKIAR